MDTSSATTSLKSPGTLRVYEIRTRADTSWLSLSPVPGKPTMARLVREQGVSSDEETEFAGHLRARSATQLEDDRERRLLQPVRLAGVSRDVR